MDEIREFIGADSLGYLSIRGVLAALDLPYDQFCFACFDGNYPVPVPYDAAARKFMLEPVEADDRERAEDRRAGRRTGDPRPETGGGPPTPAPGWTSPPASERWS